MSNYGDQFMKCPVCGAIAESEAVDVGVGLYIKGDFKCSKCNWELDGPEDFGFIKLEDLELVPIEAYEND